MKPAHLIKLYKPVYGVHKIHIDEILRDIEIRSMDYDYDTAEDDIKNIIEKGFNNLITINFDGIKAVVKIRQTNQCFIATVGDTFYGLLSYILGENQDCLLRDLLYDVERSLLMHENYKSTYELLRQYSNLSDEKIKDHLKILKESFACISPAD